MQSDSLTAYRAPRQKQKWLWFLCFIGPEPAAAEKIVYSTTLQRITTAKTRLERRFEADVVQELKAGATRDLAMGGPTLAAHAIRAGLVDEYHLLIAPVIAGGGNPYLPGKISVKLELLDERRFDNGLVYVRYRAKS